MDFGRRDDLDGVDFRLPDPDPRSVALLARAAPAPLTVRVGAPTWTQGFDPAPDPLARYAGQYTTVELNASFHAVPAPALVRRWCAAVGPEFRFCPKVPRSVSHEGSGWAREVGAFTEAVAAFGPSAGPRFFQAPPEAGPADLAELDRRLRAVGPAMVELRHPAFFPIPDAAFAWLARAGIGLVVTDTPGRRDAAHATLTTPVLFLRLMLAPHPSTARRLQAWAERVRWWGERGLREAWVFVHAPDNVGLPSLLAQTVAAFGAACVSPGAGRQARLFG